MLAHATTLLGGGMAVAGEAGPEAILPLQRGRDGRLGVAAGQGQGYSDNRITNVSVTVKANDPSTFRRSTSQIMADMKRRARLN